MIKQIFAASKAKLAYLTAVIIAKSVTPIVKCIGHIKICTEKSNICGKVGVPHGSNVGPLL